MNWHEYFIYKDGDLIWKERPVEKFKTKRAWKTWNSTYIGRVAGTIISPKGRGYSLRQVNIRGKIFQASRIVWEMFNGPISEGMMIYHIDSDGLNNRIENLTIREGFSGAMYTGVKITNTSYVTGVCWSNRSKVWVASIQVNYKSIFLGQSDDFSEACRLRKAAEKKYKEWK